MTKVLLIALVACSSSKPLPAPPRHPRTFDVLSEPGTPGVEIRSGAHVDWKRYRDCRPSQINPIFFPDAYLADNAAGWVELRATATVPGVRLTGTVTCETDEE